MKYNAPAVRLANVKFKIFTYNIYVLFKIPVSDPRVSDKDSNESDPNNSPTKGDQVSFLDNPSLFIFFLPDPSEMEEMHLREDILFIILSSITVIAAIMTIGRAAGSPASSAVSPTYSHNFLASVF